MIFGIIILVLVLLVAYFHYMQGLLNGVISAVCAAIAAALALGFHENVIAMIAQGKLADQTHALVLVGMFAAIYLILRVIFDKLIPGQIRFPAIVDKIGGAITGLIAGVFAIGILVIAAQTLPFGPAVGDYARWELEDREVKVPTQGGRMLDAHTHDEMKSSDPIKPDDRGAGMLFPVDDIVVNFVNKLSDGGSLAGDRSLASVHPAYNDESFFQRLGIQLGAKHVAMNTAKQQHAKVENVYIIQQVPQGEAEIPEIRQRENLKPLASTNARAILVVRVEFGDNATDSDKRVRLAPVGVRLVAGGKNYLPLGTLDAVAGVVYANKPDDFLLIEPNKAVDFVFDVSRGDVFAPGAKDAKELTIADGVFVEIKRLVRANLGGRKVSDLIDSADSGVIRKAESQASKVQGVSLNAPAAASGSAAPAAPTEDAPSPVTPAPAPAPTQAPTAAATPPPPAAEPAEEKGAFKFATTTTGGKMFAPVSVGKAAAAANDEHEQELNSGKAVMRSKKIAKLELHKNETLEEIGTGNGKITALFIPSGKTMIQISGTAHAGEPWLWAENLSKLELVDDKNGRHKPYGALAKATNGGKVYFVGKYDCDSPVGDVPKEDCTPTDVHIIFLVPENTAIKSISYDGEKMTDISVGTGAATKPATQPATQGGTPGSSK